MVKKVGGRLGNGSTESNDVPQLVQMLKDVPIASAKAGAYTSLARLQRRDVELG